MLTILQWIKRIIFTLILLEVIYLVVFNAALNIPYTQTLVNKIKPDKFKIFWESAWTPYPLRIHAKEVSVTGETKTQEWQVDAGSGSASISILSLLKRNLKIYNIVGYNAAYFQRSKIKPDKDYSKIDKYFPPIKGRGVNKLATTGAVAKHGKAWRINIGEIDAHGHHTFWFNQIKGDMDGDIHLNLSVQTHGGPFSIRDGKADITLNALRIKEGKALMRQTQIKGRFGLSPIVFTKNKGIKILSFIAIDIDITGHMNNLDYLSTYLEPLKGMRLQGKGVVGGHLSFDKGKLLAGTDVKIDAKDFSIFMLNYKADGDCQIELDVTTEKPDQLGVEIVFDDLQAYTEEDKSQTSGSKKIETPLFSGNGLAIKAKGSPAIFPHDSNDSSATKLEIEIPSVTVGNLNVLQQYIPHKWPFNIYKGQGELHAKVNFLADSFDAEVKIRSKDTQIGINRHRFKSDLDLLLKLSAQSMESLDINMSGSYLSLKNSRLFNEKVKDKRKSELWNTKLAIDKGTLTLQTSNLLDDQNKTDRLFEVLKRHKLRDLLDNTDAELKIAGNISQIEWINLLLKNSLGLSFSGSSKVDMDLLLKKGWSAKGSIIKVKPGNLKVDMLDYDFRGDGILVLKVEKGGESPNLGFDLNLHKGLLKRKHEKRAVIKNVTLHVQGVAKNLSHNGPKEELDFHLKIPSAEVKNVSVYNHYLPKNSPLRFIKGYAKLTADIKLKHHDAKGYIKLKAKNVTMQVDEQKISTKLALDVKLRDGIPKKMKFDISGTTIKLYDAKVIGSKTNYREKGWSASATLKKAHIVWKDPVRLDLKSTVKIKDSRPIVALLDNERKKHNWISNLLTVENIRGVADLKMVNNTIRIPYVYFKSDKIDLGIKGIINPKLRDSIFYLRYKKLDGTLKTRNGKKHFGILKSKKKFNSYVIP